MEAYACENVRHVITQLKNSERMHVIERIYNNAHEYVNVYTALVTPSSANMQHKCYCNVTFFIFIYL